jgi:hypothetical protein
LTGKGWKEVLDWILLLHQHPLLPKKKRWQLPRTIDWSLHAIRAANTAQC